MSKQSNEAVEKLATKGLDDIIVALDAVKDEIADARNGDYSTEARKQAIEAIDSVMYNKLKAFKEKKESKNNPDNWI